MNQSIMTRLGELRSQPYRSFSLESTDCAVINDIPEHIVPLVSISVLAYNHEQFIRQALDSLLEQETDFPYEIVIGEDCSTDRTREIVVEYQKKHPDKIVLLLARRNVGMCVNNMHCLAMLRGEFFAVCEGDDFWNCKDKLQRQIDFLRQNPEYSMVFSDNDRLHMESGKIDHAYLKNHKALSLYENFSTRDLIYSGMHSSPATCSYCGRLKYLHESIGKNPLYFTELRMGDWLVLLEMSKYGKFGMIREALVTYRVNLKEQSACQTRSWDKIIDIIIDHALIRYDHMESVYGADEAENYLRTVLAPYLAGLASKRYNPEFSHNVKMFVESLGCNLKFSERLHLLLGKSGFLNKVYQKWRTI